MGASIYGDVSGASRKGKELYAKVNGVNRKIKGEYAKVNGVIRQVYSGYQCQGKKLEYGTISENGAISFSLPGCSMYNLFYIHFDKPITISSITKICISQLTTSRKDTELYFYVYNGLNIASSTEIARYHLESYHANPIDLNFSKHAYGDFQDFYFRVMGSSDGTPETGSAAAGSLYIGEQITSVELI